MPPSPGRPATAFAGLCEVFNWPDGTVLRTFSFFTTNASAMMAELHDRMSLILEPDDWRTWLGEVEVAAEQDG